MAHRSSASDSWPAVVALFFVASLTAQGQQATAPAAWTTRVRGTVIRSDTRQPVTGASVSIVSRDITPVRTDNRGRFQFDRIPPGRYRIQADPTGYLSYGVGDGHAAAVEVVASRTPGDVTLVLTPFGTISGTIRDPQGQLLPSTRVQLTTIWHINGRSVLQMIGDRLTDDRGRYRMSDVKPGVYFVRVEPPSPSISRPVTSEGWMHTYFPAATDPESATAIAVMPGADLQHDITIQTARTYSVSGTVDNQLPEAERSSPAGSTPSFYLARAAAAVDEPPRHLENVRRQYGLQPAPQLANAFEVRGIAPGTYDLFAVINSTVPASGIDYYVNRTRITVTDRDLTDVRIVARRGQDVRVREISRARASSQPPLSLRDKTPRLVTPQELSSRLMSLTPREPIPTFSARYRRAGRDDTGIFTIQNVTEGSYDVQLDVHYPVPPDEYLADIRQDGKSVFASGIVVTQQPSALIEVIFDSDGGTVAGTVRRRDRPPAGDVVVGLMPREPWRRRVHEKRATLDAAGAFSFTNVPPGDYVVYASTTGVVWDIGSDSLVSELARHGRPITVGRGAAVKVALETVDAMTIAIRHEAQTLKPRATASTPMAPPVPATSLPVGTVAARASAAGTGTITGVVVLEGTSEPAAGVDVGLVRSVVVNDFGSADPSSARNTRTGLDGRFTFSNLPPGDYGVNARSAGFLPSSNSTRRIVLSDGATADTGSLTVQKGGVIAGRLLDDAGRPVRGGRVAALTPQITNGQRTFSLPAGAVETNDLGEFRIFWLSPGPYFLAAAPPSMYLTLSMPTSPHTIASTFFPGVREVAKASTIVVAGGEVRADFSLARRDTYTISGQLTATDPAAIGSSSFYLMPRGTGTVDARAFSILSNYPVGYVRRSGGDFTLSEVPSGSYDLYVTAPNDLAARVPVMVDRTSITGLVGALSPLPVLTLRVTVDGAPAPTAPRLRARDPLPSVPGSSPTGAARGNGVFAFPALEGRYHFDASDYSTSAYIADIRDGNTSLFDQGIENRPGVGPLDVSVKTDGGTISARVTGTDPRTGGRVMVMLAPTSDRRHVDLLYRTAEADMTGLFNLRGIIPGDYIVFVVDERDWQHGSASDIAARHASTARTVTVAAKSFQEVQLSAN